MVWGLWNFWKKNVKFPTPGNTLLLLFYLFIYLFIYLFTKRDIDTTYNTVNLYYLQYGNIQARGRGGGGLEWCEDYEIFEKKMSNSPPSEHIIIIIILFIYLFIYLQKEILSLLTTQLTYTIYNTVTYINIIYPHY